jgi:hypothetical protein
MCARTSGGTKTESRSNRARARESTPIRSGSDEWPPAHPAEPAASRKQPVTERLRSHGEPDARRERLELVQHPRRRHPLRLALASRPLVASPSRTSGEVFELHDSSMSECNGPLDVVKALLKPNDESLSCERCLGVRDRRVREPRGRLGVRDRRGPEPTKTAAAVRPLSRLGEGGSGRRSPGCDVGAVPAAVEPSERSESRRSEASG